VAKQEEPHEGQAGPWHLGRFRRRFAPAGRGSVHAYADSAGANFSDTMHRLDHELRRFAQAFRFGGGAVDECGF
jgi:hypothetical protein